MQMFVKSDILVNPYGSLMNGSTRHSKANMWYILMGCKQFVAGINVFESECRKSCDGKILDQSHNVESSRNAKHMMWSILLGCLELFPDCMRYM